MRLVYEQGITGLYGITFLDNHLGLQSCEILGAECILARTFHRSSLLGSLSLQVDVQALTQFDYFCHILLIK